MTCSAPIPGSPAGRTACAGCRSACARADRGREGRVVAAEVELGTIWISGRGGQLHLAGDLADQRWPAPAGCGGVRRCRPPHSGAASTPLSWVDWKGRVRCIRLSWVSGIGLGLALSGVSVPLRAGSSRCSCWLSSSDGLALGGDLAHRVQWHRRMVAAAGTARRSRQALLRQSPWPGNIAIWRGRAMLAGRFSSTCRRS